MEALDLIRVYDGVPVPYSEAQLRQDLLPARPPSGPLSEEFLAENNVFRPRLGAAPVLAPFERARVATDPVEVSPGVWEYPQSAEEISPEEKAALVTAERDRRLLLDFEFQGKMFQRDSDSLKRITGAAALALGAMMRGAEAGDLFWHGRATPFVWIASDDSLHPMDAPTCWDFGAAAAAVETELIFAAKALREMDVIPADFTSDKYWAATT